LVMIHGAGGSSTTWFMQMRPLGRLAHVVALDLNGHGQTPDRNAPDVTRSYLDDIETVVAEFDRPILVGHSMGGALSQLYALKRPQDIRGLVLVGTGAKLKVLPIIFDLLDSNFEGYVEAAGRYMFTDTADKSIVQSSQTEIRKCQVSVIKRDFAVCNGFDVMDTVNRITLPTLILVGQQDVMTPVKYAEYLAAKIAGSSLHIIPNAGHSVMLEQYKVFNDAVAEWIREAHFA